MKIAFSITSLVIFSLFGISFTLTPIYSENECDIDKDLQKYQEILQDDIAVKTFMQKYPAAISLTGNGIDDSDPPQTSIHYRYEDNTTSVNLTLRILGYDPKNPNDCFVPFSYTLNYQNDTKTIQITNYQNETVELLDFLNSLAITTPITQNDILVNYQNSDIILEGKIISSDHINNQTSYDVEVEYYYKGNRLSKLITVFESEKQSFEQGNRVVLYIQQKNRYLVQEPSFRVDYDCNSGIWGSILAPKYEHILMRGSPATGNFPEFGEPDHPSGLYRAEKPMKITYHVENFGPMIKHANIGISIVSKNQTVFSDERSITIPACSGRVPLSWNFTPDSGDHVVYVTVSGTYTVDGKSFEFQEPKVSSDFKARKHWSGVSLDKTIDPVESDKAIPSPLQQFKSGIEADKIICKQGLELVIKSERRHHPICVTPTTKSKLIQMGFALPIRNAGPVYPDNMPGKEFAAQTSEIPEDLVDCDKIAKLERDTWHCGAVTVEQKFDMLEAKGFSICGQKPNEYHVLKPGQQGYFVYQTFRGNDFNDPPSSPHKINVTKEPSFLCEYDEGNLLTRKPCVPNGIHVYFESDSPTLGYNQTVTVKAIVLVDETTEDQSFWLGLTPFTCYGGSYERFAISR